MFLFVTKFWAKMLQDFVSIFYALLMVGSICEKTNSANILSVGGNHLLTGSMKLGPGFLKDDKMSVAFRPPHLAIMSC